jgi:coenzyme F420-0:L-glutamate ligase
MIVRAVKTRIFREGEDLVCFIEEHIPKLSDGSILAVTSKIVALAERRTASLADKDKVVVRESTSSLKTKYVYLTLKDGMFMANAGVDDSNGDGKLILLPKDSFKAAELLRKELMKLYRVKKFGVVITDSRVAPLRAGVTGIAMGYAGFMGIKDYRGKKDIFGRKFVFTRTSVADSIAGAVTVVMGEGAERQPLAVIEGAPVVFSPTVNRRELIIPPSEDMYGPLLGPLLKSSKKRKK